MYLMNKRKKKVITVRNIIKNVIKCNKCGEIIESVYRQDFKTCSCRQVSVDGGLDFLRRCFADTPRDYTELSEFTEL